MSIASLRGFRLRLHSRMVMMVFGLMGISLLILSSAATENFASNYFMAQVRWFLIGWVVFFLFALLPYQRIRSWAYVFYFLSMILLIGLFFTDPIQNVHRWYKIPLIGSALQPTEYAKIAMILALARFLESRAGEAKKWSVSLQAFAIFFVPFILIMKQPDLGSALILYPVALALFYMGGVHPRLVKGMAVMGLVALGIVLSFFLGFLSHDEMRPYATTVLREYQYERLSPNTYHQRTAQAAIALGGVSGTGWGKSELTAHSWLPAAHTDSVFAAYAEEFGLMGIGVLLLFFSGVIYCGVQIASFAVDTFGRLLATGGVVFLAMHACINIGMMCGTLPITGVPLLLISYGGSSVLSTMMMLGILQSIYRRRFIC